MLFPVAVVNFKAYKESTGRNAISLAEKLDFDKRVVLVPSKVDVVAVKEVVSVPVFCQGADPVDPGARTGRVTVDALASWGIDGILVNHSEDRVTLNAISVVVEKAKEYGMEVIVCAVDDKEAAAVSALRPTAVAVEPPELIGGDISVSAARPELIEKSVRASEVPLLVGAGIKTEEDVRKSIELGAKGILVASGVVKAKDPAEALKNLLKGM